MNQQTEAARLERQIAFIVEVDRLKQVLRHTLTIDGMRRENSAEHSWQLALMALVLAEYVAEPLDLAHVIRLVLVHDIVEIDAGDTFAFDAGGNITKPAREQAAANRLYGLLPSDQAAELRAWWDEFEAGETPEARYANALDRLVGLLTNTRNGGGTWRQHGISVTAALQRLAPVRDGAPGLWPYVERTVAAAHAAGWLTD
ncbi:MAG TPA: HD domain-containing protein [Roseiflexaceae bacterium]|nr:HD domain-containing protein [Roseiflexaceae bacterium]HMP41970.1 HD domain-containing protein [Roseiflexaceae bacterium]